MATDKPTRAENKTARHSHGGYAGRSLIQRIEQQMDKRRKAMEQIVVDTGKSTNSREWTLQRGRYEGFAASLALLRTSSVQHEIERSNERLGIS